jgi:hypothetical protein
LLIREKELVFLNWSLTIGELGTEFARPED